MDDRRPGAAAGGVLQRRAHEKRKAARVVRIVGVVDGVEAGAIVEIRTIDQDGARFVGQRRLIESDIACEAADGDGERVDEDAGGDAAIAWERDRRVPPESLERGRQRPEDVRQPACFRERLRFRSDQEDGAARDG
jgi:hypothetical protein